MAKGCAITRLKTRVDQARKNSEIPQAPQDRGVGAFNTSSPSPITAGGATVMKVVGNRRSGHKPLMPMRTAKSVITTGHKNTPTPNCEPDQAAKPSAPAASGASTLPTTGVSSAGVTVGQKLAPSALPPTPGWSQRDSTHRGPEKNYMNAIHGQLSPLAKNYADGPRKAENMILNRNYQVERVQEAAFDAAVNVLGDQYDAALRFRYIGPLPAYSFVNIELNQGNFALLDGARKTLQLPETATREKIKTAHRQLLLTHHPDRNPDNPLASQQCKAIVATYGLVMAYCQSIPVFAVIGHDNEVSFAKEEVEKTFIVDTKGAILARGA